MSSAAPTELVPASDKTVSVKTTLHPNSSMTLTDLKAHLSREQTIDPAEINEDVGSVMLDIKAEYLGQIAWVDNVHRIQELSRFKLHNYTGRKVLKPGVAAPGKKLAAMTAYI